MSTDEKGKMDVKLIKNCSPPKTRISSKADCVTYTIRAEGDGDLDVVRSVSNPDGHETDATDSDDELPLLQLKKEKLDGEDVKFQKLAVVEEVEEVQNDGEADDIDDNCTVFEVNEFECVKCSNTFTNTKTLERHLTFCQYTSEVHLRMEEMQKNLWKIEKEAANMEKRDVCFCCDENYDLCHSGHINCAYCPKTFKTQNSLERHIFLLHAKSSKYACSVCNAHCISEAIQELHEKQHKTRGKPFACKKCGKEFTRNYHVLRHEKRSACGANQAETMSCNVCGKSFYRLDNLRDHLRTHLGIEKSKKEFACPYCEKEFASFSILNIHIRTHTGERPFPCDLCEKSFPSNVALRKHRRYHTGERPYTCSVCSQSFAAKEVLNRHMKRHTGDRPHVCTKCPKTFIQAVQLKNHLRSHENENRYECEHCDEKFRTKLRLQKHFKDEHAEPKARKRPSARNNTGKFPIAYMCDICNKSFVKLENLNKHMKLEEEKEKSCPDYKHQPVVKKERKPRNNNDAFDKLLFNEEDVDFGQKKKCIFCSIAFTSKLSLLMHFKTDHKNEMKKILVGSERSHFSKLMARLIESKSLTEWNIAEKSVFQEYAEQENAEIDSETIASDEEATGLEEKAEPMDEDDDIEEVQYPLFRLVEKIEESKHEEENTPDEIVDDVHSEDVSSANEGDAERLKRDVTELLNLLVDSDTLRKFGWPNAAVDEVLYKVIENCGHSMDAFDTRADYVTRMREYVKLLFKVVIDNDSIRELLNNHSIDEVIHQVLQMAGDD